MKDFLKISGMIAITIGSVILVVCIIHYSMPYIINNQKVPNIRVGMCIANSFDEFTLCQRIYKVEKIGSYNVLVRGTYEVREISIDHLRKAYGEVDCECTDFVKWK